MNVRNVPTLASLQADVKSCEAALNNFNEETGDPELQLQLKDDLRHAREDLRIFSYKAKPCLTKNGKVLRP
jgi:hypothetical protein